jgi:large subunit ribosomal protein L10
VGLVIRKVLLSYMAKTKAQKQEIIEKLQGAMKESSSSVFVHFSGLTVADESAMRRSLREQSVRYTVARKTLIRRALSALGLEHESLPLEGEVAVAYGGGDDSTAAARLVHKFGEKLAGKLTIVGGIFEGALKDQAQMQEIATIPSLEVLRGMFAQVINSPRQRFAVVLSKVAETKNA